jgi:magnesium transporter
MLRIFKTNCETLRELTLASLEKGAWLNLTAPDAEEVAAVADLTGVPLDALKAALDEEERSRVEIEDNYILVITNVPTHRESYIYDTLPLGIVLTRDYFITVCLDSHQVLEEFAAEGPRTFSTYKKTRFLFQLLYKSAILYLKYLKQINRSTDEIERDLRRSVKNEEIFELLELQKGLTFFTASLRSNGIVLERLLRLRSNRELQHLIAVYEEDEDLLEDVIIENKQAIEMVEMYSNVLSGMMGAFTSIISNNLNLVLKFLASVTILLAIPTMVASFWGMNVEGLPFSGENGFLVVILIALATAGVSAYGLWRRGLL